MQSVQRFGGAMFTPVLLLAFSGIMIGLSIFFTSTTIFGDWAGDENNLAYRIWSIIGVGGWTIFKQMPIIFVAALPIGLAKKQHARACLEALLLYLTFNYFMNMILSFWGGMHQIDITGDIESDPRLTQVAGIPTLNMGIAGSLLVSGIVVWLHNRCFDKSLPVWLSAFNGSAFICAIGFFFMFILAFICVLIWPVIQDGIFMVSRWITSLQEFGVFGFTFLERALIPFGLHHLIYFPVHYDNLLIDGGTYVKWLEDLPMLAASTEPLRDLAPYSGFQMTALSAFFGVPGICMAFVYTAKKENRKKLIAYLIPLAFSAMFCAITEPIEFTFLFVAPALFIVHSLLAATLATTVYVFGIVGSLSNNFFEQLAINYIPLWPNHWNQYIVLIIIGLCFTFIYFLVFSFLIKKFNFKTPGRSGAEIKFNTKAEYKEKKNKEKADKENNGIENKILELLGGKENVVDVTNCATRLRVNLKDSDKVGSDEDFKAIGTHGAKITGKSVQVIIGLEVPKVREKFEALLNND